jgi:hypothetical protein
VRLIGTAQEVQVQFGFFGRSTLCSRAVDHAIYHGVVVDKAKSGPAGFTHYSRLWKISKGVIMPSTDERYEERSWHDQRDDVAVSGSISRKNACFNLI